MSAIETQQWYFTRDQLVNTPSRRCGMPADKEVSARQQAANFLQDLGQKLGIDQICINTAIVYIHRFFMCHSFTKFHRIKISICALLLAAKVEQQNTKLEFILVCAHHCLNREAPALSRSSDTFRELAEELVINESLMLKTLGFDLTISHPHTHLLKCCQMIKVSNDLIQASYIIANTSLHLTTMSIQYHPTVVACVCFHLLSKWANLEISKTSEGRDWFWYVDKTVTVDLLDKLTEEFVDILDCCPSKLKHKIFRFEKTNKQYSGISNSPTKSSHLTGSLMNMEKGLMTPFPPKPNLETMPPRPLLKPLPPPMEGKTGGMTNKSAGKRPDNLEMGSGALKSLSSRMNITIKGMGREHQQKNLLGNPRSPPKPLLTPVTGQPRPFLTPSPSSLDDKAGVSGNWSDSVEINPINGLHMASQINTAPHLSKGRSKPQHQENVVDKSQVLVQQTSSMPDKWHAVPTDGLKLKMVKLHK